jgi:hypothetical protein
MTARFNLLLAALLAAGSLSGGAVFAQDVDFGDDSGPWTRDGECDDPRFEGPGMAAATDPTGVMTDASDCRKAFANGLVSMIAGADMPEIDDAPVTAGIDFGGDTGTWINDGECDDPRFTGPGMSAAPVEADIMADASDCRALFDAGQVQMAGDMPPLDGPTPLGGVDFGADTSPWINDGECDDPRFEGPGMAQGLDDSNILGDASDCRALFDAGQIQMAGGAMPAGDVPSNTAGGVDFGADTSPWINDGECDDPRFEGAGMAQGLDDSNILGDASDCRALFDAGQIQMAGGAMPSGDVPSNTAGGVVDFGDDSGQWTFDGECDDPRFAGEGMADVLEDADLFADATDCQTLYDAGMITLTGANPGGAADPMGTVDFGADSGQWTMDGECDDPRFVGEGMADVLQDVDLFADATDCRTLYDAGMISLRDQ